METLPKLETKVEASSPNVAEIGGAFDEFMSAFEAFKGANDQRLDEIEKRMSADVISVDKVERINRALNQQQGRLDELTMKSRRPALSGSDRQTAWSGASEHKQAFDTYVRKGDAGCLADIEAKSLSVGSDPDGGYLVPDETETEIGRLLSNASPIRAIADVRQVSSSVYKKPFTHRRCCDRFGSAKRRQGPKPIHRRWPNCSSRPWSFMPCRRRPRACSMTQRSISTNGSPRKCRRCFPSRKGPLLLPVTASTSRVVSWTIRPSTMRRGVGGNIGYLATGVSGDFAATDPSDVLIDLIYATKAGYRQNAHWVMNRKVQGDIRKIKDVDGNYIWQPAASADGKATLMNFPIAEAEDMPDKAADSFSVALRRLPPWLFDRRPGRYPRAARSVLIQAVRAVLHHQARRRRRAEF